jgi:hypothetical protein
MAHWARQMAGRIPQAQKSLDVSCSDVLIFQPLIFTERAKDRSGAHG